MKALACFDFDGTLTRGDSLLPFLLQVCGGAGLALALLRAAPALAGFALGRVRNDVAKQQLLRHSLGGRRIADVAAQAQVFIAERLPALLRPELVQRLHWHLQQGHVCVLVSASPALYVEPWSRTMGFHACLATALEVRADGRLSGCLQGANCHGEEKLRRLGQWLAELGEPGWPALSYAYGDTRGDLPLLRRARHGHWVGGGVPPCDADAPAPLPG